MEHVDKLVPCQSPEPAVQSSHVPIGLSRKLVSGLQLYMPRENRVPMVRGDIDILVHTT